MSVNFDLEEKISSFVNETYSYCKENDIPTDLVKISQVFDDWLLISTGLFLRSIRVQFTILPESIGMVRKTKSRLFSILSEKGGILGS